MPITTEFEFEYAERRYSCAVRARRGTADDAWWWFSVAGDPQSYAPFQTSVTDTQESVQQRVVDYYSNRLFQLAQPSQRGGHWSRRTPPAKPAPPADE